MTPKHRVHFLIFRDYQRIKCEYSGLCSVLGVEKNAGIAAGKAIYKSKAFLLHLDMNPDNAEVYSQF